MKSIVTANPFDMNFLLNQVVEVDIKWAKLEPIALMPHPGVEHPEAIEADYQMKDGVLILDMRAPLVGYALRRWAVDCSLAHSLNPKEHQLRLKNLQTLYGVESATLAPGYLGKETSDESL
jgi:hypothetical protein